ncbi:hypothetical protein Tco_0259704 [Tanacetum coccineum]
MKIQAGVQVLRPGELRRHLQLWKRFRRLYFVVIVLDRNIIDEDEEISEDASPEFLEEIKSLENKKVPIIADHQRMESTLKDMMKNQFRSAEEADNKAYIFYEEDYQYLKKNDIEDIYYLCLKVKVNYHENGLLNSLIVFFRSFVIWERVHDYQLGIEVLLSGKEFMIINWNNKKQRRVLGLRDIPKFCDATLEKVVKEVSAIVCVARYILKKPPPGDLDEDIIELFETKIKKRLKHRRKMRRIVPQGSVPSPGAGHMVVNTPGWLDHKESGPSPPGEGHGVPPSVPNPPGWLEQKESGPSPGEGHGVPPSVPNPPSWLAQKESGPSPPGEGHKVPNPPGRLVDMPQKISGPSPRGKGHGVPPSVPNPPSWLEQKEPGPSPGEGHGVPPSVPNPPGWLAQKESGPSPPGEGHKAPNPPSWLSQKESGPSPPGEGHKVPNPPGWLVDMPRKISGSSPRGKGHGVPPGAPGGG